MILGITGHRPQYFAAYADANGEQLTVTRVAGERIKPVIVWAIQQLKPTAMITGMALGVDQWAAEVALSMGLPFHAAIPCHNQDAFWKHDARKTYSELLKKAATVQYITNGPYAKGVMALRNQWIVDRSNSMLAVFDGSSGGTSHCVQYAIQQQRPVLRYNPRDGKTEWLGRMP